MAFRDRYRKKSEQLDNNNKDKVPIDDNYFAVCELLEELKGVMLLKK